MGFSIFFASPSALPPQHPTNGTLQKVAFSFLIFHVLSLEDFIDCYVYVKAFQSYLFGFKCFPEFQLQEKFSFLLENLTLGAVFSISKFKISEARAPKILIIQGLKRLVYLSPSYFPPTQYKDST